MRETRGEQHRVLLGDPHVVVLVGPLLLEDVEPGAGVHRGGDAHHPLVALALLHHRVAEDLGVLRRDRSLGRLRLLRGGRAVEDRVGLGRVPLLHALEAAALGGLEALALHGVDVDDHRPLGVQGLADRLAQGAHVVAVDHPDVGQVELLEEQAGRPVGLQRLLEDRAQVLDAAADAGRELGQPLLHVLAGAVQLGVQPRASEQARERADVRRDRHAVVVEHDHDRQVHAARVVQGLEGHSARERAVADHGDDLAVVPHAPAHGLLEAHRVGDRGGGVAGAHDVVLGLVDRAEGREAAVLADRVQAVATAGEHLVGVGLVADVPQHLVGGRVEQAVQRHRQLAGAEVRAEVPADLADRVDDQLADLLGHLLELIVVETLEVVGAVDLVE